jgi:hypothetical protein
MSKNVSKIQRSAVGLPTRGTYISKGPTKVPFDPEFFVTPKAYVAFVGDTLMKVQVTWSTCELDGSTRDVTATVHLYRTGQDVQTYDGHIRWQVLNHATDSGTTGR